jgi:chloramphenicol-sensitive protein RarD
MSRARGLLWLTVSYVFWGFSPFYWKLLAHVPPLEVMIHRCLWTCVFLFPFLLTPKGGAEVRSIRGGRGMLLVVTSGLIVWNWYNFVTAMVTGQVLQSSLAYALNPLMNIVLGLVLLKEPLSRPQWVSVAIATMAVMVLIIGSGEVPGLALILAGTFSVYGYMRKKMALSGTTALWCETAIASPFLVLLLLRIGHMDHSWTTWLLLVGAGPVTALPLIWYVWGVQAVPFSMAGFLQFMLPVIQFLLAVLWFHEDFGFVRQMAFGMMGLALAIFCVSLLRSRSRRPQPR